MKTTVTNNSAAIQGVWTADEGLVHIEPGKSRAVTIADDYVERFKALPYFSTGDAVTAGAADLDALDLAGLIQVAIADGLIESEEVIASDLRRVIISKREFEATRDPLDHDGDGKKGGMEKSDLEPASAEDIATAIGMLDAKNDDHWTSAGLPAVDAVRELAGKTVTRAAIAEAAPEAKRPAAE